MGSDATRMDRKDRTRSAPGAIPDGRPFSRGTERLCFELPDHEVPMFRMSLQATLLTILTLSPVTTGAAPRTILEYGHDYVVSKACAATATGQLPPLVPIADDYRLKLYLNFDGAKLTNGGNDSAANKTDLINPATLDYPALDWQGYGGKEKALPGVVDELKLLFLNYAVEFVTERPASGDYTMAMVGGIGESCKSGGPGTVGIAPLDCKNSRKNDVVLVFGNKVSGSPRQLAYVIAHELGHSFGLEHVDDTKSIMYPALNAATCCWVTSNVQPPSSCGRTSQDDAKVLADNLGAGPGDTIPPKVWFVRPGAGAVLPPSFSFEVAAADDLRVHHVVISVDGTTKLEVRDPPYAASVSDLAPGEHTLRAEVFDWKPNTTSVEIKITVDPSCAGSGSCWAGPLGIGGECAGPADCTSGLCLTKPGELSRCSESCDPATKLCPAGTSCETAGGQPVCAPAPGWTLEAATGGGGCTVAGTSSTGLVPLLVVLVLALARRRR